METVKLDEKIVRKRCWYRQIERTGQVAIYSMAYSDNGPIVGYDLFIIKIGNPHTFPNGIAVGKRELFPHDEAFGSYAWSYTTYQRAKEHFDKLVVEQREKAAAQ